MVAKYYKVLHSHQVKKHKPVLFKNWEIASKH